MRDTLRIYSKTKNWGDTLLYTINADLLDYSIQTRVNQVGGGTITLNDSGSRWSDTIGLDNWNGTAETVRVWRLHDAAGNLIVSGVINGVDKVRDKCVLNVQDMNGLLRRRVIDNKSFSQQAGTYILTDSTLGLLPVYLTNLYSNFADNAAYITYNTDAASTTYLRYWKFDGTYLSDAVYDVTRASYGANSRGFYGNLYETFVSPNYIMNFDFKEKETATKTATLSHGDVRSDSFNFKTWSQIHYNQILVRGGGGDGYTKTNKTASNEWWTEQASEAAYDTFWYAGANGDINRETTTIKTGTSSVNMHQDNADNSINFGILLADADAYNASYTPDSNYFVSGSGVKLSLTYPTYLHFWTRMDWTNDDAGAYIDFYLRGGTTGGGGTQDYTLNKYYKSWVTGEPHFYNNVAANTWYEVDINVNDIIPATSYGYCNSVWWNFNDTSAGNDVYIDDLYFYTLKQASSSAKDGTPTYLREYIHTDTGLTSDFDCLNMSQNLKNEFNRPSYQGNIELFGEKRNSSIRAGSNVELVFPMYGVNVQAGQTPAQLMVEGVSYRPNTQVLSIDRSWTEQDAIEAANRNIRLANKVQ